MEEHHSGCYRIRVRGERADLAASNQDVSQGDLLVHCHQSVHRHVSESILIRWPDADSFQGGL